MSWIFNIFKNRILLYANFLKIRSSINLPWGHARSHTKFGSDRFCRFDVYWIQTNKPTPRKAKIYKYIYHFDIVYFGERSDKDVHVHKGSII